MLGLGAFTAKDLGSMLGWRRSPGEEDDYSLQYSCLENSMDRGAWQSIVYEAAKNQTRLSDKHFHFHPILIVNISIFYIHTIPKGVIL